MSSNYLSTNDKSKTELVFVQTKNKQHLQGDDEPCDLEIILFGPSMRVQFEERTVLTNKQEQKQQTLKKQEYTETKSDELPSNTAANLTERLKQRIQDSVDMDDSNLYIDYIDYF